VQGRVGYPITGQVGIREVVDRFVAVNAFPGVLQKNLRPRDREGWTAVVRSPECVHRALQALDAERRLRNDELILQKLGP
jgi:hypothetical protein